MGGLAPTRSMTTNKHTTRATAESKPFNMENHLSLVRVRYILNDNQAVE
jgi:hypothetical protein